MKRLVVTVTVSLLVLMLSYSIPPAQAASDDGVVSTEARPTFYALSQIPGEGRPSPTPLSDAELDSVVGAAGGLFALRGLAANLGIIIQINVCAVCTGVTQSNFAFLGQSNVFRFGVR